jgi:REP element-mobilizing transposase RayT
LFHGDLARLRQLVDLMVTQGQACVTLMPNHVHLLLGEKRWKIGDVMKSIASSYVFYYNKKYGRVGHLEKQ